MNHPAQHSHFVQDLLPSFDKHNYLFLPSMARFWYIPLLGWGNKERLPTIPQESGIRHTASVECNERGGTEWLGHTQGRATVPKIEFTGPGNLSFYTVETLPRWFWSIPLVENPCHESLSLSLSSQPEYSRALHSTVYITKYFFKFPNIKWHHNIEWINFWKWHHSLWSWIFCCSPSGGYAPLHPTQKKLSPPLCLSELKSPCSQKI